MKNLLIMSVLVAAFASPLQASTYVDTAKDAVSDAGAYLDKALDNSTLNYVFSFGWLVDLGAWMDSKGGVPADLPMDERHN